MDPTYEQLRDEGLGLDVERHWGAGFLAGRYRSGEPSWSYAEVCRPLLDRASAVLDMGTGDGRVLAGLAPFPPLTVAYEEWRPTVPAAVATLQPLGVHVVAAVGSADNVGVLRVADPARPGLPFAPNSFDLVLNRHTAFDPWDLRRLTRPGGTYLTQQVGLEEQHGVRRLLGLSEDPDGAAGEWSAAVAVEQLESVGWRIVDARDEHPVSEFSDIAALIGYVRSTPWAYPDLDWRAAQPHLRRLHDQTRTGPLRVSARRFLVAAES